MLVSVVGDVKGLRSDRSYHRSRARSDVGRAYWVDRIDGLEAASIGVAGDWRRCGYRTTFDSVWYRYLIAVMEAKLATKIAVELKR